MADTAVNLKRVKQIIQSSEARAKVIILDACHSGAQIGKKALEMTEDFIRHVFAEAEGMAILSSCKQNQVSCEWPEKGQSVFTYYLLEGLRGAADFEEKGFVTVGDISRYLADRVKAWAVQRSFIQIPTLQYSVVGDIVLTVYSSAPDLKPLEKSIIILDKSDELEKSPFGNPDEDTQIIEGSKADESLDTKIMKSLYGYFQQYPGDPGMTFRELNKISESEQSEVIQCIYGLQEKGWIKYELTPKAEIGLIWLTQVGIRLAKDLCY